MRLRIAFTAFMLAPGLVAAQAERASPIGRVTVLPIVHDRLPRDVGLILAERVARHLVERNPSVAVVGPGAAAARLDSTDLRDSWDRFAFTFMMTGIPDPVELERVCAGLEVDAILQMEVSTWVQRSASVASPPYTNPALRVGLRAWLFDCHPPRLQGEKLSEGRSVGAITREKGLVEITAASAAAAVGAAVDALLNTLPILVPDAQPSVYGDRGDSAARPIDRLYLGSL